MIVFNGKAVEVNFETVEGYQSYSWNFGDGMAPEAGGTEIEHTYKFDGNYSVMLAVSDGEDSSWTQLDITVIPPDGPQGEEEEEEEDEDEDEEFDPHEVKLICDSKSYLYLNGTTLDFKDEIMGRGFVFKNPNATNTCGCGESFSI